MQSFVKIDSVGLANVATIFRRDSLFQVVKLGRGDALIKAGTADGVNRLAARAAALIQSRGCANMQEITEEAREIFGPNASEKFVEAAVRTVPRFEWLDQKNGWFWYMPDHSQPANELVRQIKRILGVASRVSLAELRSAIGRRGYNLGNFAPPLNVLASICRRLLFVHLVGDTVVRVGGLVQWDAVLAEKEETLVNILRSHGPILGREVFCKLCRDRGVNQSTFDQLTLCSSVVMSPFPDTYALVGTTVPAGTIGQAGTGSCEGN
jgi:hypothetical protein